MPPGTPPRRPRGALALIGLACACALAPGSALGAGPGDGHQLAPQLDRSQPEAEGAFVPGEAIVRFEPGAAAATRRAARERAGVGFEDTLGLPRAQVVDVDGPVQSAVRRLEAQPGVAYAQPNYRYEATAVDPPDDTFFDKLWGLEDPTLPDPGVGVLDAWQNNRGEGQTIAILDTGVDLTHPDLLDNLWENPDSGAEDVHGYDFVDDDGDPDDFNFHGTHVAGTAAAASNNDEGIAGVAPAAQIMAVRVLDGDGSGYTDEIAKGVIYAAEKGADVINMSLGGPENAEDSFMQNAIEFAGSRGVVVVVAAGNEDADNDTDPHTPCALPNSNMICVAALNQSGALAGFSNYGKATVDIAAPGTSILSAKTDYGPPVFSDGFETTPGPWVTATEFGGKPWGPESATKASGSFSATDSPLSVYGQAPDEDDFAASYLYVEEPVDLSSERGCRIHFRTKYEIEDFFDLFGAGAFADGLAPDDAFDGLTFDGKSPGFPNFLREEASISELDGRLDVHPEFAVLSDYEIEQDGAYVDDVRLICRDETYEDKIVAKGSDYDLPESGNYVSFQGTSMASPHVAGVVALVRAAAPGLDAGEAIAAVLGGASAIPKVTSGKRTATEGIADACKAVAIATGADIEAGCPASSEPEPQPDVKIGGGEVVTDELQEPLPSLVAPAASPEPPGDRTAPGTAFWRKAPRVLLTPWRRGKAVFRFRSNEAGVVYLCQFDRKRYRKCGERFVRWFLRGRHVLRVKARDAAGNVDRTPAVHRFRVKQVGSKRQLRRNGATRRNALHRHRP